MTDFTKVDAEFDKEFNNDFGTPCWCCGGDFCNKQDHIDEATDIKSFWHSKLEEAVGEERKFIGKQRREWYMRGVREERESLINKICQKCKEKIAQSAEN